MLSNLARPPRWLFLACLVAIYLSSVALIVPVDTACDKVHALGACLKGAQCKPAASAAPCATPVLGITPAFLELTLLVAFMASLLWFVLFRRHTRLFFWAYLGLQGVAAAGIGIVTREPLAVLALYLTVLVAASPTIHRMWEIVATASLYELLLLGVIVDLGLPKWLKGPAVLLTLLQSLPLYGVILLVSIGYVVVHVQLAQSHEQLRESAARIEELTLAAERQRLARELHDTLSQGLAGVVMQLNVALARLSGCRYEHAERAVQQAMENARGAMAEARSAIDNLRAVPAAPGDILEVVQGEIARFGEATGIPCTADLELLSQLPPEHRDHCVRFIREGLTNIARHARASHASVFVEHGETGLTLSVSDDGVGFDPTGSDASRAGHYGLVGLRERARLTGGRLEVTSASGSGTTLRLHVPEHRGPVAMRENHGGARRRRAVP